MTADAYPPELAELRWDGDECEIDGITYTLEFRQDGESIDDIGDYGDTYGRTKWSRDNDYGPVRPSDFTGRARVLFRDHGSSLWWEPYWDADYPNGGRGESFDADAEYRNVLSIMEAGFYFMVLESGDGYTAAIGGIEPEPDNAYILELVRELYAEIAYDRERARVRQMVIGANRWLGTRLAIPR